MLKEAKFKIQKKIKDEVHLVDTISKGTREEEVHEG